MMLPVVLFIFIVLGILNAGYLYWQEREHERRGRPMLCPLDGECEKVVFSRFGTTFGVKNEVWGLLYYFSLIPLLVFLVYYPPLAEFSLWGILILSSGAFLFSSYLFFVQLFIIRDLCSWCLLATAINYVILILELIYILPL
jgi:uncharacterized membrane protein